MPATDAAQAISQLRRHGIYMPARGTFVAAGRDRDVSRMPNPDIRFGICLWPSELMAYIEVDDAFTDAAVRLRQLGPKIVAALQQMQVPLEDLKNRTVGAIEEELTLELVERTPLAVDQVASYLAELLDHVATIIPSCYGADGAQLNTGRGGLRRLASCGLSEVDTALAEIVAPGGSLPDWAETLTSSSIGEDPDFTALPMANDPNIYLVTNHPNFDGANPEQKLSALKASANQTIAAAEAIDDSLQGMFTWLDALLDHLIEVVCERAIDGDQLRQRWESDAWTVIQRLSFVDTDAALAVTRAFPAISDGPLLPGTESE
ncbi:MAG: hypothetical protein F4066_06210 [Chloroflexi bacterium]|nr:hypothetical protein [Chloroflexota bacterium]MYF81520.1 hypothetical protein [Chloroflexota bacterium]MYI04439.1 hypothetical protein [Chloroflexota bacterium]